MTPEERASRLRLADSLEDYALGRITNQELDKALKASGFEFHANLFDIWDAIWGTYDDFKTHRTSTKHFTIAHYRRLIAFLRSDLEYVAPPIQKYFFGLLSHSLAPPCWPFLNQRSWISARNLTAIPQPLPYDRKHLVLQLRFFRRSLLRSQRSN